MKICTFPYDFLGQTETTTQQIGTVMEHMNATQFEFPGSRSEQGSDSVATVALANKFWGKVKPDSLEWTYERFKWDFVLAGYPRLDNPNSPYLDFDQEF